MGLTGLGIPRKSVELYSGCVSVSRAALPSEAGSELKRLVFLVLPSSQDWSAPAVLSS